MMLRLPIKFLLLLLFLFFSFVNVSLSAVPEGFEDLTIEKKQETMFIINDKESIKLLTYGNGNNIKLMSSEIDDLEVFLKDKYVKKIISNKIIKKLEKGVNSSLNCIGRRDSCHFEIKNKEKYDFVIVNDGKVVRVLLSDDAMSKNIENKRYISNKIDTQAVIMTNHLSIGAGADMNAYGNYRNQITAGFLGGYIKSDLFVSSNDDDDGYTNLDQITYNYLTDNHELRFGYTSDNVDRSWNGTNILDDDENRKQVSMDFGTTSLLLFKNKKNEPRLYFSIPASGRLIVTKEDGAPVLERNVNAGQQYISYNELPKGIHTLTLRVVQGKNELYHEKKKIYNSEDNMMKNGQYDFLLSTGVFLDQDLTNNISYLDNYNDFDDNGFIEGRIATQFNDYFQLGVGVLNSKNHYYSKVSYGLKFDNDVFVKGLYGVFDDNSKYTQLSLGFYQAHLDWSYFNDYSNDLNTTSLANYLYGFGSAEDISLGYSKNIFDGSLYVNYSYSHNDGRGTIYLDQNDDTFVKYSNMTLGYSFRSWLNSTIDANVTYSSNENTMTEKINGLEFALSVSVPLTSQGYVSYSMSGGGDYKNQRFATGNNYNINSNLDVSTEAGITHEGSNHSLKSYVNDLSASVNYHDDKVSASAFSYAATDGTYNSYADLTNTLIMSKGQFLSSSYKANSYLVVTNSGEVSDSIEKGGDRFSSIINIQKNDEQSNRLPLDKKHIVYGIDDYKEYSINLDESASDFNNYGDTSIKASSYPGTILNFATNLHETKSFISIFNDIDGDAIESVKCIGEGCVSVEELSVGVFKFRVIEGLPFRLNSHNERCIIPNLKSISKQNLGDNFCMPEFESDSNFEFARNDNGDYLYYIGKFKNKMVIDNYENNHNQYKVIRKKVGDSLFVFIDSKEKIPSSEMNEIDGLTKYAIKEKSESYYYAAR